MANKSLPKKNPWPLVLEARGGGRGIVPEIYFALEIRIFPDFWGEVFFL